MRFPAGAQRWASVCCLAPLALLVCAACSGSNRSTVKGKVLYKGAPIEGAVVTFHPKGAKDDLTTLRPSGLTDKEGNFTLSTGSEAGAPPGDYVVTVNWHKPEEPKGGKKRPINTEPPPVPPDQFQGKPYADRERSQLTAKVGTGTTTLEPFNLD